MLYVGMADRQEMAGNGRAARHRGTQRRAGDLLADILCLGRTRVCIPDAGQRGGQLSGRPDYRQSGKPPQGSPGRGNRGEPAYPRHIQVCRFLCANPLRRRADGAHTENLAAHRHQFLHLPVHLVPGRHLPPRGSRAAAVREPAALHLDVPAAHCRSYCALRDCGA